MKRVRLTSRIANRILIANSYETLTRKLLNEHEGLKTDAEKYMDGETKGFVFHHLNFGADNILPTLSYKGDRIAQAKYLNKVIDYSRLRIDKAKEDFIRNEIGRDDIKACARDLETTKNELDAEMKGVVFIPKRFHSYLHSSKCAKLPRAKNSKEVYEQFLAYRGTLKIEAMLKKADKEGGPVFKKLDILNRIVNLLLCHKRKDDALKILKAAFEEANDLIENK